MKKAIYLIMLLLASSACSGKKAETAAAADAATPEISAPVKADADSLYALVEAQTSMGPRTPGSAAHARCRDFIQSRLKAYGADTVAVQQAPVTTFEGKTFTAFNIMGRFNPGASRRVLLLAHYDTRPWADRDADPANRHRPIDGANDGASGVAGLLEIARVAGDRLPEGLGLDLLFVDMEDSGEIADMESDSGDDSWALGTKAWAAAMPYTFDNWPRYAILLDMIGGRDARFHREYFSEQRAGQVVNRVWRIAAQSGFADRFPNSRGGAIDDDHLPLLDAGVACIDIIESANPETGSFNPTWHTMDDNLANIDRRTMQEVVQVVLNTLYSD